MVAIEPFPFIIGRDEDCNLKLTDKRFSRHHLEIRNSGDHLWIRDFESTNGTFVNQKATTDTNEMSRLRNALGKLNIDLAFDDFGVGQTRLMELAKAPPDFLKFDKSLIRQIHLAPKRLHQMVSTFVKAAQDLALPLSQRELNALMRLKHANGSVLISLRAFSMAGPCPSTKSTKHI